MPIGKIDIRKYCGLYDKVFVLSKKQNVQKTSFLKSNAITDTFEKSNEINPLGNKSDSATSCIIIPTKENGYGHGNYTLDESGMRIYDDGTLAQVTQCPGCKCIEFDDDTLVTEFDDGTIEINGKKIIPENINNNPSKNEDTPIIKGKVPATDVQVTTTKDGREAKVILKRMAFKKLDWQKFEAFYDAIQKGFKNTGGGIASTSSHDYYEIRPGTNGQYGDLRIVGKYYSDINAYVFDYFCDHKAVSSYIYSR